MTDASLIDEPADKADIEVQTTDSGVFSTGNDVEPIREDAPVL
ncbi:MAG: hypothetical protein WD059_10780 [Balneolaceae bacterium]